MPATPPESVDRNDRHERRARRRRQAVVVAEPTPDRLTHWHERLGRWQSLALLGGGAAYALGYLARALHAWDQSLGVLPALDFQYLIAGLLLALPLGALALAFVLLRALLRAWVAHEASVPALRERINRGLGVLQTAALLGVVLTSVLDGVLGLDLERYVMPLGALMLFAFGSGIVLALTRDAAAGDPGDPGRYGSAALRMTVMRRAGRVERLWSRMADAIVWFYGLVVMLYGASLVLGLVLFALLLGLLWLPQLPQELGGAKPRCMTLDLDTRLLSPDLAGELLAAPVSLDGSGGVRRTRELAVHYSGGDLVLLRLAPAPPGPARTLELRRSAVVAAAACPVS